MCGPQRAGLWGEGAPSNRVWGPPGSPGPDAAEGPDTLRGDRDGFMHPPPRADLAEGPALWHQQGAGPHEGHDARPEANGPSEARAADECNAWSRCAPCRAGTLNTRAPASPRDTPDTRSQAGQLGRRGKHAMQLFFLH